MLGIGLLEIPVIAVVALIALGPKHLPSVLRKIALVYKQLANLRNELKSEIITISHMTQVGEQSSTPNDALRKAPSVEVKDG